MTGQGKRQVIASAMRSARAVAVVRLPSSDLVPAVVEALVTGGLSTIELTLTTPGALPMMLELGQRFGSSILLGAGSVRGAEQARSAVEAGAQFLVTPIGDQRVLEVAHAHAIPVALGAFTPTEMAGVHDAGADFVKLFPADQVGPAYVRGVLAPMPHLAIMPTGGVTPDNVHEWLAAGCVAVGLGSSLVDAGTVARGEWPVLVERAQRVTQGVQRASAAAAGRLA